jgi:hypothetical protein
MIFAKSNKARGLHPIDAPWSMCTQLEDLKILESRLLYSKYSRLGGYTHWVHLRCTPIENNDIRAPQASFSRNTASIWVEDFALENNSALLHGLKRRLEELRGAMCTSMHGTSHDGPSHPG